LHVIAGIQVKSGARSFISKYNSKPDLTQIPA